MINLMRKNQRTLMVIVAVLTIISMAWLYNQTNLERLGQSTVATIYGKPVDSPAFERTARQLRVAYGLGLVDLVQILAGRGERDAEEEYVWNTMVLRRLATQLQIAPSDDAVQKRIQELTVFQTDNRFDMQKYQDFLTNRLTPQGYTTAVMEEIVRDELRLARIKELVGSTVSAAESEVREAFGEAYQKRHVSFVRLNRDDFAKSVTIKPEEIKEAFEKSKDTYRTEEKRVVKYIAWKLSDKDQALTGKELVAALKPLSAKAEEFSQKMLEAGAQFDDVTKKLGATSVTTDPFTQAAPPAAVADVPTFAPTAFSLTKESPDSDVLQTQAGFYILHLEKIETSQPKTLEQASAEVTAQLTETRIREAMTARAKELRTQFTEALKGGKTFAQAAEGASLKAEAIPAFSPAEPGDIKDMTQRFVLMSTSSLQAGGISDLVQTPEGGAVAFLEKVDPLDPKLWTERRTEILARYTSSKRDLNFAEWLKARRQAADVRVAGRS